MNRRIGGVKILLVDEHQMMWRGFRQLLSAKPDLRIVGEAMNSRSALDQIRISAPHLVLMDINVPGACRIESARRMVAEFPAVKIIAFSSNTALDLVLQALRAGVSGYAVKDDGFEELFRAIYMVMDFHIYLSPEVSSAVTRHFLKTHHGPTVARVGLVLSDREWLLLRLIAEGKRNKEIAGEMAVSAKSVETYRFRLMKKLGCASPAALVRYAIREGVVQP